VFTSKNRNHQKGFTIVELLVATAVFGVLLLIVTIAVLQFSRVYYRGVTEANTQDTARTVVDRISQAIQFNGGTITATPAASYGSTASFCVGNQQYTYILGKQLTDTTPASTQTYHALVSRDLAGCVTTSPTPSMSTPATSGRELLSPKMRLAKMQVTPISDKLYKISVRVVFGDEDLLSNPTTANAACNAGQGSQFCAVSDITTVVTKRVE
jgi:prepilin-type N-terminal cleavage/methylation domain-containing protein